MEIMGIEDIKEAIEVLEDASAEMLMETGDKDYYSKAIAILRAAIEQTEKQEPVAWINKSRNLLSWDKLYADMTPLYTAPVDAVNTSQERVNEIVKQEHDRAVKLAQAYERGWNAALAQQEPVLWLKTWSDGSVSVLKTKSHAFADRELEPLYSAPPKKEWVGLTDEEVSEVIDDVLEGGGWLDVARALEAKLKEKNQ